MPKTEQGKAKLRQTLAQFHAERAQKMIEQLPCPTEQKLEFVDAMVKHIKKHST